ncbi:hypothetical protein [Kitasatospora sp. NPDC059571]|uniref:hypothetical protein n=1 Tax=Kitasatospora sp. NPDC059571 TaxID=3346871 RepID=UPI00369BBDF0
MPPYEPGPHVWPFALLLLLICLPKNARRWLLQRLQWLGLAVAVLLLLPYLLG